MIGGGAGFAAIENGQQKTPVTVWDGFWWAITTATTVGYGDLYPVTDSGRLIAIGLMLVGIAFVGFCTAAIAQRFIVPIVEENIARGHDDMTSVRPGWGVRGRSTPTFPPPGRT